MVEPIETPMVRLGDVASFIRGVTFKPSDVQKPSISNVDCMRTKNVQAELDRRDVWSVPRLIVKRQDQLLRAGDLLVSSANSWNLVGKACWIPELDRPTTFGGFVSVLRPEKVDARYLFRWFSSDVVQTTMRSFGNQTTNISNLDLKRAANLRLLLPPLDEQRRIAAILDKADELRFKRRQSLAHLDTLTQSIFHSMFGNLPSTTTLGELCGNRFRNGVSPSTRGTIAQKVLTLSAVTGSSFDPTAVKLSTFEKPIPESNQISSRLLLICRGNGNRALVGKGFFPRENIAHIGFPDTVIAAEPNADIVAPLFLEAAWGLPSVRAQLESAAKTTNGTFKINQTSLAAIQLPLPPLELQRTFATRVAAVERLKESHRKHLAELDALFASLQHRAFKGEL